MGQVVFSTAEEALAELKAAIKSANSARLIEIFGKTSRNVFLTGDAVSDNAALKRFSQRFEQRAELFPVNSADFPNEQWYLIRYGIEAWNMRVPLINRGEGWTFASEYAGAPGLKIRRSLNEIAAVDTLRALVKAQNQYKSRDRNGDGVPEFAQKFISSPGKQDGLYWPENEGSSPSPLDGLVARAIEDGYKASGQDTQTYGGYVYRMLSAQGGQTRGGKKNYLKDGRLVNGFAIIAYPVKWNVSGDATFLVGQDGQVWKKDLLRQTESLAPAMKSMDMDSSWLRVDPNLGGENSRSNW
jgi:hypothetical protein